VTSVDDGMAQRRFPEELLALEPCGVDRFAAQLDDDAPVAFGGDTLARTLHAAALTCDDGDLHSLHARFLRPVPGSARVEISVERVRDGRRLRLRHAQLTVGGRPALDLTASFAAPAEGHAYQEAELPADLPPPESLAPEEERARSEGRTEYEPWSVEWRWAQTPWKAAPMSRWAGWVRHRTGVSGDPRHHEAALVFLSDFHSDFAVSRRVGGDWPRDRFISLDHAIWVHRPVRWRGWWAVESESDVAHAGRALTRRRVFDREGALLATVVQEALLV